MDGCQKSDLICLVGGSRSNENDNSKTIRHDVKVSTMELTGVKSGKRNGKKKLKRAVVRLAASKIENKLTPADTTCQVRGE